MSTGDQRCHRVRISDGHILGTAKQVLRSPRRLGEEDAGAEALEAGEGIHRQGVRG